MSDGSDLEVGVTVVHRRPPFSAGLYCWDQQGKFNLKDTQETSTTPSAGSSKNDSDGETLVMGPQVLSIFYES